ncbi:DUF928 domain-containing protein [Phormidesmis priestleyi]
MTSSNFATSLLIAGCLLSVQAFAVASVRQNDRVVSVAASPAQKPKASLRYTPPKLPARGRLRSTQGAGSRGGEDVAVVQVKLLAPTDHVGRTTAGHPTFFWYVSSASGFPIEFALFERGVVKPIFVKQMSVKQAGIIKLEMPSDRPELQPGKEYRWSVSIVQFPTMISLNPVFQSFITRVELMPDQAKQLASVTPNRDRAAFYAEAGIWYDALEAIATDYLNKPIDPTLRADLVTLLNQIGLPQVLEQKP